MTRPRFYSYSQYKLFEGEVNLDSVQEPDETHNDTNNNSSNTEENHQNNTSFNIKKFEDKYIKNKQKGFQTVKDIFIRYNEKCKDDFNTFIQNANTVTNTNANTNPNTGQRDAGVDSSTCGAAATPPNPNPINKI